jgi:hypothetical protein
VSTRFKFLARTKIFAKLHNTRQPKIPESVPRITPKTAPSDVFNRLSAPVSRPAPPPEASPEITAKTSQRSKLILRRSLYSTSTFLERNEYYAKRKEKQLERISKHIQLKKCKKKAFEVIEEMERRHEEAKKVRERRLNDEDKRRLSFHPVLTKYEEYAKKER